MKTKGSVHKPVFLTAKQAYHLVSFLDDFSYEFNKYSGQATAIMIALKRVIPNKFFEEENGEA